MLAVFWNQTLIIVRNLSENRFGFPRFKQLSEENVSFILQMRTKIATKKISLFLCSYFHLFQLLNIFAFPAILLPKANAAESWRNTSLSV